jgi:phage repressor protein C with HTH and peptisase S24 domain
MEENRIIDRLDAYMRHKGYSDTYIQGLCGLSNGTLNKSRGKGRDLSRRATELILNKLQDINRVWLTTGVGVMELDKPSPPTKPPGNEDTILIPVASSDSIGGTRFNQEVNTEEYITGYLPFPTSIAHHGDVVIPIYGDSMEPTYKAGSMVLIREVELWREYLELGCTYVIGLVDDRRVIKTVMAGNDADHFLLVSINPAYQPQEIDKKIIRSVWRVILSVRREAL